MDFELAIETLEEVTPKHPPAPVCTSKPNHINMIG